ncbi:hypothetical protein TWF696_003894 [Orbilia brochopaga]|uniref:MARVEL domain-containing protein n=1 Tax=Orbilia brochopaga TaxID=3140254 RepID=A0AAV9V4H3_9PEZI
MAGRSGSIKTPLWAVRFLQLIFAIILTGIFAWFHNRIYRAGYYRYDETDVPLGFSVAAIFVIALAFFTHLSLGPDSQIIIMFLDFALFVGYLASAVVYRHNFNANCNENTLVRVFRAIGRNGCNTVRLGAALLVLQTILFFISTVLTHRLADRRYTATAEPRVREEKTGFFGFGRRRPRQAAAV